MTILTTVAAIVISFCLLDIFHTKSFNYPPHFTFINLFRRLSHAKTQSRYDLITARKTEVAPLVWADEKPPHTQKSRSGDCMKKHFYLSWTGRIGM